MKRFTRTGIRAVAVAGALLITAAGVIALNRWWVLRQIELGREVVTRGEQLWPDEMRSVLAKAESNTFSRAFLAKHLTSDPDPSLVAEGLLMLTRHPSAQSQSTIERHLDDQRVNHLLYTNGQLARLCLRILAASGRDQLTREESALME